MKPRRERVCYSVALDKLLIEALRKLSDKTDLSMSHLIRTFIRTGLEREQAKK
jgi:hypothetical protein